MKKILVPTDFSDNAYDALTFAVAAVNQLDGHIVLYHVYRVGTAAAETFKSKLDEIVRQDKERAIQEIIDQVKPTLKKGTIEGQVARGDVEDLIVDKAAKQHFDIIIMGSKGETGIEGLLLGNTALTTIRNAKTPVVVIPAKARPRAVRRIVLAVDGKGISNPDALEPLIVLTKIRNASIEIFHRQVEEKDRDLHPSIAKGLEGLDFTYHLVETGTTDISDSIRNFTKEHEADLVCLIRRKKGWLERLFKENVTRDSLIDVPIPMLILKDM